MLHSYYVWTVNSFNDKERGGEECTQWNSLTVGQVEGWCLCGGGGRKREVFNQISYSHYNIIRWLSIYMSELGLYTLKICRKLGRVTTQPLSKETKQTEIKEDKEILFLYFCKQLFFPQCCKMLVLSLTRYILRQKMR